MSIEIDTARQMFAMLLSAGFIMLAIEIYVPGGILGLFGAVALVGAMMFAFPAFEPYGAAVALAIILLGVGFFVFWLKIAPKTWIGRKLTIQTDLSGAKGTNDSLSEYLGKDGVAACNLRPSGFAIIDKHRVDVVTRGEMIDCDEIIEVIDIESNRVIVKKK